jgi:tetratricopeptide (TPR) repeat protein
MSEQGSPLEVERPAHEALLLLDADGDDEALVHVWHALAWAANMRGSNEDWAEAAATAMRHVRHAGRPVFGWLEMMLTVPLVNGPRPAGEALATVDAALGDRPFTGALLARAVLFAMLDRIDEAWALALPEAARLRELGLNNGGEWLSEIALIAGDYDAAVRHLRDACDGLEAAGNFGELSTYAPRLGRVLCLLGRHDEAEPLADRGRELGSPDDIVTQMAWRQTQALVYAGRGQHADAERLAREAVDFACRGDSPLLHGEAFSDLAEVLEAGGRQAEAITAWQSALECYELKPIIPLARYVRERLAALEPA